MSIYEDHIEAVLFDYGMVLSGPPDPAARVEMERILGVDPQAFHTVYWKHRDDYDRGALNGISYWEHVALDLHRELSAAQLDSLIAADTALWTQPNVPMILWAQSLQGAGIKTGILSNLGDAMEAGIRARFPWLEEFTHHTFSHRLGVAKPDPGIYLHAAEGLKASPAHVLFIDDRAENVAAAKAVGMSTIHYTDHEHFLAAFDGDAYGNLPKPAA
jgi:putative hydrolase of the HAD superfamily